MRTDRENRTSQAPDTDLVIGGPVIGYDPAALHEGVSPEGNVIWETIAAIRGAVARAGRDLICLSCGGKGKPEMPNDPRSTLVCTTCLREWQAERRGRWEATQEERDLGGGPT